MSKILNIFFLRNRQPDGVNKSDPVATCSGARALSVSHWIAGSNPAQGMDVCLAFPNMCLKPTIKNPQS
jgi:hypothetical protein